MRLRNLLVISAVVYLLFGLGLLLTPVLLQTLYGVLVVFPPLIASTQLLGAFAFSIGVLTWSARNAPESEPRRAIVLALFVANAIGFIVVLLAQLAGAWNALGWFSAATFLLLALGYGYFQFFRLSAP